MSTRQHFKNESLHCSIQNIPSDEAREISPCSWAHSENIFFLQRPLRRWPAWGKRALKSTSSSLLVCGQKSVQERRNRGKHFLDYIVCIFLFRVQRRYLIKLTKSKAAITWQISYINIHDLHQTRTGNETRYCLVGQDVKLMKRYNYLRESYCVLKKRLIQSDPMINATD